MVSLAHGTNDAQKGPKTRTAGADSDVVVGGDIAGILIAAVCFLVVLAAIAWGIYEVYKIGHPAPASERLRRGLGPGPAGGWPLAGRGTSG